MFCQNCGNQLIEGARFCNNCGQAAELETPVVEEAPVIEEAAIVPAAPAAPVVAAPAAPVAPVVAAPAAAPAVVPEKKSKGNKVAIGVVSGVVALAVLVVGGLFGGGHIMYNNGNYESARSCFNVLGSDDMVNACDYAIAGELAEAGEYEAAWEMYDSLKSYEDSYELAAEARVARAQELFDEGRYEEAYELCKDAEADVDCEELMTDCHINMAIDMYNEGNIEDAYDIFLEYSFIDNTASAYSYLCLFKTYESGGYADLETAIYLYGELEKYMDIDAVKEVLESPFFFYARLFEAEYKYRHYTLDCYATETAIIISYYLPWRTPGGEFWTDFDEDGFYFYQGEHLWFGIVGFSSYDTLHPEEMYVLGVDETYTFTLVS